MRVLRLGAIGAVLISSLLATTQVAAAQDRNVRVDAGDVEVSAGSGGVDIVMAGPNRPRVRIRVGLPVSDVDQCLFLIRGRRVGIEVEGHTFGCVLLLFPD